VPAASNPLFAFIVRRKTILRSSDCLVNAETAEVAFGAGNFIGLATQASLTMPARVKTFFEFFFEFLFSLFFFRAHNSAHSEEWS